MSADEFDIIAKYFAPLATLPGARGLIDDAALLEGGPFVVTTDAIVEGVHFLANDPIDTIARKALRVNVSDLTAKAAAPHAALLTLIWPRNRDSAEIETFASALADDLRQYGMSLLGGDTTSTDGPLTISITAFGKPLGARTPSRADARAGEDLWVTGTIGDAYLGLNAIRAGYADEIAQTLAARYRVPNPPVQLASVIATCGAAMDVSDGLFADTGKIAAASNVAIHIEGDCVPISAEARAWMEKHNEPVTALLSGGDDYQVLFTADPSRRDALGQIATRIGRVEAGAGVFATGTTWQMIGREAAGYSHKLGR